MPIDSKSQSITFAGQTGLILLTYGIRLD